MSRLGLSVFTSHLSDFYLHLQPSDRSIRLLVLILIRVTQLRLGKDVVEGTVLLRLDIGHHISPLQLILGAGAAVDI